MRTEKEHKKALRIIKRLISLYPYVAEECQNNKGKPCTRCQAILNAKSFIEEEDKN